MNEYFEEPCRAECHARWCDQCRDGRCMDLEPCERQEMEEEDGD